MTADFGPESAAEKMMKKLAEVTTPSPAGGKVPASSLKIAAQVLASIPTTGDRVAALRASAIAKTAQHPKHDFALGQGDPPAVDDADDELDATANRKKRGRGEPSAEDDGAEESGEKYEPDEDDAPAPVDNDSDVDREYKKANGLAQSAKEVRV